MTAAELKDKIKRLAKQAYADKAQSDDAAFAYDELTKFPELKVIIVNLLTAEFDSFLESIDWVSPRPSIFRINLLNGQSFLLEYNERSWIANVEGKKYYLLNLDEEERAAKSVGRILQYGPQSGADVDVDSDDSGEDDNLDEE